MTRIVMICILTSAVTAYLTAKVMAIHYLNVIDRHTREMTKIFVSFLNDLLDAYVNKRSSKGSE